MNTSRGCPYACAFCSVGGIWGRRYTCFSAERVLRDVQELISRYGIRGVYFREDNFTINRERVVRFCEGLLSRSVSLKWACETRVDTLDRELVSLMALSGCRGLYLGIESGSERMLGQLGKGIHVEQIERAFAWCGEHGIGTLASCITGIPGDTKQDHQQTKTLLKRIQPTKTCMNPYTGLPGSRLYRDVLTAGTFKRMDENGLLRIKA